jgi:putative flippase GtrA
VIGGVLFLAGLTFQAALTSGLHVPSILSYVAQAVLSVEASFLLNRWLTWRKRATAFWPSFGRYNLQKTITVAANLLLYAGLLRLGMNYLIANVLLTAVFTIVNYIGGDRFVFTPGNVDAEPLAAASVDSYQDGPRSMASAGRLSMAGAVGYQDFPELTETTMPLPGIRHQHTPELTESAQALPTVSVVIPCRDNHKTIRAAVVSLLRQDYPELREIILIGSPVDATGRAWRVSMTAGCKFRR